METKSKNSGFTSQHLVTSLLLVFIGLSVFAMFTTSRVGEELSWIGMTVKRLDAEARAERGIPANVTGVVVTGADGMAGKVGVRPGDVVVGINGNAVRDMYDFSHYTGEVDIARSGAQIDVVRNGLPMPLFIFPTAAPSPATGQVAPAVAVAPPFAASPQWLGIEGDTVRAADAIEVGLPSGAQGVLVDAVAIGSRAQQSGLARRDVIVAVNGQRISSASGLWSALSGLNGADTVQLGVYRGGQLLSVIVPAAGTGSAAGLPAAAPGTAPVAAPAVAPAAVPAVTPGGVPAAAPAGGFTGRMGGLGLGPGGFLVCPGCGTKIVHQRGVPCFTVACPSCGRTMTRLQ